MVVADEVRKLAERTTDATADIGKKIHLQIERSGTEQAITAIAQMAARYDGSALNTPNSREQHG